MSEGWAGDGIRDSDGVDEGATQPVGDRTNSAGIPEPGKYASSPEWRCILDIRNRLGALESGVRALIQQMDALMEHAASGMSASGQDAEERLEAKPASPAPKGGDAQ